MPFVLITDDTGKVLYSRRVSKESLNGVTAFLKRKLPFIKGLQQFKEFFDIAQTAAEKAGLLLKINHGNTNRRKTARTSRR